MLSFKNNRYLALGLCDGTIEIYYKRKKSGFKFFKRF